MKTWVLAALISSCGIMGSDYVQYEGSEDPAADQTGSGSGTGGSSGGEEGGGEEGGGEEGGGEGGEDLSLTTFEEKISPAISSSCAGCHATGGQKIAGGTFAKDPAKDKAVLFKYTDCDSAKLVGKMDGTESHTGGKLIDKLPAASIEAWLAEEPSC